MKTRFLAVAYGAGYGHPVRLARLGTAKNFAHRNYPSALAACLDDFAQYSGFTLEIVRARHACQQRDRHEFLVKHGDPNLYHVITEIAA